MSKLLLILVAMCVGLGLLSLHLVSRLRDGDATIAELKRQVATLQAGQQRRAVVGTSGASSPPVTTEVVERPLGATPPPPGDVPKADATSPSAIVASNLPPRPSREEGMRLMREHRERQRQLMQDPEYREAMRLQARTNLARQYPGVIEELGLDQSEAEAFFGILADQQMRSAEQMESLWDVDATDNPDPATLQQQRNKVQQAAAELQRNNEAELVARFGQQKLQAWKEYQSTIGQRWQLEQMRSTLAAQGLPLSDDYSKPMLKAMAEAQQQEIQEYAAAAATSAAVNQTVSSRTGRVVAFGANNMEQQIAQTKKRNQRMLDAISSYLTFEQRQALEKDQEAQLKMQEAQLRLMRARGNNNSSGFYTEGAGLIAVQPLQ